MSDSEVVTPAALLNDLQFDTMSVDTTLAEDYVKKHNGMFYAILPEEKDVPIDEYECDNHGNRIYYHYGFVDYQEEVKADCKKLREIAKKIEENADLFAQLEYLLRKSNIEDVKMYDIKMLSNTFEFYAETPCRLAESPEDDKNKESPEMYIKTDYTVTVEISDAMPLAALGVVAELLSGGKCVQVRCAIDTAVIGHLFVSLCHEAGFSKIDVVFSPVSDIMDNVYSSWNCILPIEGAGQIKDFVQGSVVVVTEKSDLDSAVACIVGATHDHKYPWRLRRVIVQETVYERFSKALARICDHKPITPVDDLLPANVTAKATQVHITNGKIFLFDYPDTEDNVQDEKPVIYVEGYRTTKELLSLLKKYKTSYLSLWCSNVSVKDEIAFGTDASHIWINDFGVFDDPKEIGYSLFAEPEFSRKYYLEFSSDKIRIETEFKEAVQKVSKLRENWIKKDSTYRREAIKRAIDNIRTQLKETDQLYKLYEEIYQAAINWKPYSFAKVNNGMLTIAFFESVGIVALLNKYKSKTLASFIFEIQSVLNGNGIIYSNKFPNPFFNQMIISLQNEEVPIVQMPTPLRLLVKNVEGLNLWYSPYVVNEKVLYKIKVIKSKFGETFAN